MPLAWSSFVWGTLIRPSTQDFLNVLGQPKGGGSTIIHSTAALEDELLVQGSYIPEKNI